MIILPRLFIVVKQEKNSFVNPLPVGLKAFIKNSVVQLLNKLLGVAYQCFQY